MTSLIRKTINDRWSFPSGKYGEKVVGDGLDRLCRSMHLSHPSNGIVTDFIVYQIYRYRDMIGQDRRWNVTWCFSQNAVDKYRSQFVSKGGKAGVMYYIDQWLREHSLSRETLESMLSPKAHSLQKFVYMESEEHVKRRFLNTDNGLLLCQLSTTGWSPKSASCSVCKNKESCINLSKGKYPELIRLRETTL